jgi:hypothetical protein
MRASPTMMFGHAEHIAENLLHGGVAEDQVARGDARAGGAHVATHLGVAGERAEQVTTHDERVRGDAVSVGATRYP